MRFYHREKAISFVIVLLNFCFFSCQKQSITRFALIPSSHSNIHFHNTIRESDSIHYFNFPYIYSGAGLGVADFNKDGLPDIFFAGNMVSSRLYVNKGQLQFEDVTQHAGIQNESWVTGVSVVDINQDGWMDIYLCVGGFGDAESRRNLLYLNDHKGAFVEAASDYGIADSSHSTQAAFFDYDRDGDLDLYVMNHANEPYSNISKLLTLTDGSGPSTDHLFENIGMTDKGHPFYQNVSEKAGVLIEGYGLGLAISDLNLDGWPDIYVANDFIASDLLYINNQEGTFTNQLATYTQHSSRNGMGVDIADLNGDALPDILVMDMLPESNRRQKTMTADMNFEHFKRTLGEGFAPQFIKNSLQLHRGIGPDGKPHFSEVGRLANLHQTDWSWAPLIADFDNDGLSDVYISNGFRRDVTDHDFQDYSNQSQVFQIGSGKMSIPKVLEQLYQLDSVHLPNYLFQNKGQLQFVNQSAEWGMGQASMSHGVAYADLDQDGDLDLVVNNLNAQAFLYENQSESFESQHYIHLELKGPSGNRGGIGTKFRAYFADGSKQYAEYYPVRGYLSSMATGIHMGLGACSIVDSLEVIWPDGHKNRYDQLEADSTYTLEYASEEKKTSIASQPAYLFEEISEKIKVHYRHQENNHIDFRLEPMLLHQYDYHGPGIAVGDINGDALNDFYVGGARNQPGKFFLQNSTGKFDSLSLANSAKYEDMGALLFDADGDQDLDLYTVSGGSSVKYFSKGHYQDRLYYNDGKGNFSWSQSTLPQMDASGSCVIAADFDQDQDLDLFIGGRVVPGKFPAAPNSYLLENRQGKFVDRTEELAPDLGKIGMVSSALWTDYDNDQDVDLLLAGEWMSLVIFENQEGKFVNKTAESGLASYTGWWNSLMGGDFDADGDIDYLAGNHGANTAFKASEAEPLRVYAKDFDKNSATDAIITRFIQGKEYPVAPRGMLINQLSVIKRMFPNYDQFAKADIHQILASLDTEGMKVLEASYLLSSYIENLGNGQFSVHPLPKEAQFAPIFGLETGDFNEDGHLDVLCTGNYYPTEVITGWYDAHKGLVLYGNGKGDFTPVSGVSSGYLVEGDARSLGSLPIGKEYVAHIATTNDGKLKVFKKKEVPSSNIIQLNPLEVRVEFEMGDGTLRVKELYLGQGYLSQSGGFLKIPHGVPSVRIYDSSGNLRTLSFR
ncbi:MAG: VCBS repeat-containing protein [Bacteroidota bacterium]